jgi:hypothetical protein
MSPGAFFLVLASISLVTGVLMIVLYVPLKRAIGDENETGEDVASRSPAADAA